MGQSQEQLSFSDQACARIALLEPIRPNRLTNAAARAILAPQVIDVEIVATPEQANSAISWSDNRVWR
jgi:hypothetical protein